MNNSIRFIFILLITLTPSVHAANMVDRIVALIDDKAITQTDVERALREGRFGKDRQNVIQNLINTHILQAELEKEKISVTEAEVDRVLQDMAAQRGMTLDGLKNEAMKRGMPLAAIRENVRMDLKQSQFMQKVIYPRVRVSDYDLQEYYKKHANEFKGFQKIRFLELLVTAESTPAGQTFPVFVRNLASQLKKGASFSAIASQYSKGAFAANGGDSGLIDIASMRPDLVAILGGLKPNVVSDPIPVSENAAFIFKVIEQKDPQPRPFEAVKEMIRQKFAADKVQDEMQSFLMEARSRHFVDIRS